MKSECKEAMMGIDLKKITAKQALSLAKQMSGKTNEELAEEMQQDPSTIKRYFHEHDTTYYPSLLRLPRLCSALGNSLLLDWIQAQTDDQVPSVPISTDNDLLRRINRLAGELGGVHRTVDDSVSGSDLEHFDARRLLSELFEVEHQVKSLRRGLQEASGEALEIKGWESAKL
jgi:transcriptional regulator with XRE-family HTH domain